MKKSLVLVLFSLLLLGANGRAQTVADRLRELDRLKAEGLISEAVHAQQWGQVVAEAMRTPSTAIPTAVRLTPAPVVDFRSELTFSGSWTSLDAGAADVNTTQVDAVFGRWVTDALLVFGGVNHMSADLDGDDLDTLALRAGADWHFGKRGSAFVPYVGAGVAWVRVDADGVGDEDDFAWDVHAGVRQYVGDRVVIKYEAAYRSFDELDLDGFSVSVGIGLRF